MAASSVLVPLYVYPFPGAWQPLYDAITAHPRTQFLVVINPGNGPGPAPLPDANYCREIPKLRSHSNVAVFGYVHVVWLQRDLDSVSTDVETYAAWPSQDPTMAVDGIFVDEAPIRADAHTVTYLGSLTNLVHRCWPKRCAYLASGDSPAPVSVSQTDTETDLPTIIHNPGCMPDPRLLDLTDLCVVFEDTWTAFLARVREGVFALPCDTTDTGTAGRLCGAGTEGKQYEGKQRVQNEGSAAKACEAEEQPVEEPEQQERLPAITAEETRRLARAMRAKRAVVVHSVPLPLPDGEAAVPVEEGSVGVGFDANAGSSLEEAVQGYGNVTGTKDTDQAAAAVVQQGARAAKVNEVIVQARRVAGSVFVTELTERYYESFGSGWREWAGVIGGE